MTETPATALIALDCCGVPRVLATDSAVILDFLELSDGEADEAGLVDGCDTTLTPGLWLWRGRVVPVEGDDGEPSPDLRRDSLTPVTDMAQAAQWFAMTPPAGPDEREE